MNTELLDVAGKAFPVIGGLAGGIIAVRKWVWRPLLSTWRSWTRKIDGITGAIEKLSTDVDTIQSTLSTMDARQMLTAEMLECILDFENRGFFRARPDGFVELASSVACRITGRSERELTGHQWLSRVHSEDREEVQSHWDSAREDGRDFEQVFRFAHPNGWIRVRMRAMPIPRSVEPRNVRMYLGVITEEPA